MPRNFLRRVEVMFPILAPDLVTRILKEIIPVYLADNTRARLLNPQGDFQLLKPSPGETPRRCQADFLNQTEGADVAIASGSDAGGSG